MEERQRQGWSIRICKSFKSALSYFKEETSKLMTGTLSKIRGLKVKDGQKEEKMPEGD